MRSRYSNDQRVMIWVRGRETPWIYRVSAQASVHFEEQAGDPEALNITIEHKNGGTSGRASFRKTEIVAIEVNRIRTTDR